MPCRIIKPRRALESQANAFGGRFDVDYDMPWVSTSDTAPIVVGENRCDSRGFNLVICCLIVRARTMPFLVSVSCYAAERKDLTPHTHVSGLVDRSTGFCAGYLNEHQKGCEVTDLTIQGVGGW